MNSKEEPKEEPKEEQDQNPEKAGKASQNPEKESIKKAQDSFGDFFRDRVILVTGASRGIGKVFAVLLGALGAKVSCAARATKDSPLKLPGTVDETAQMVTDAGGQGLAIQADLSKERDIENMIDKTVETFGSMDMLVNNAAVTFSGDMDMEIKRFDLVMNINVKAPLLASRLAQKHLQKSECGRILNVSSIAGQAYFPTLMAYGMSKRALDHLTVSNAAQFAPEIAVNCFRIDTQVLTEGYMLNAPGEDFSKWNSPDAAAMGMCWMLAQPTDYTGQVEDMLDLGSRTGLMPGVSSRTGGLNSDWAVK